MLKIEYIVYIHTNKINGKVYIGVSNNTVRRWRSNGIEYKPKKDENQNRPFWNAIKKYGWDGFFHEKLYNNLSESEAFKLEKELIKKHNSTDDTKGYNISKGGNGGRVYKEHPKGMLGKNQTEYQKKSQSEWASQNENNCMTNGDVVWGVTHEHPKGMLGKTHSEEYKQRLRQTMSGSNNPNAKEIIAKLDGAVNKFGCIQDCADFYNTSYDTILRIIKSGKEFTSRYKKMQHLVGLKIRYS